MPSADNPPPEGFSPAFRPYGDEKRPALPLRQLHKGARMQKKQLVTLAVLCLALAAIAMFVGGLPWDGLLPKR